MARKRGPTPPRRWERMTQRAGTTAPEGYWEKAGATPPDEVWGNDLYTCMLRYATHEGVKLGRDELLWLGIHRRDRKPIRDWRHFQAIKNEVAGFDRIAVEIYPPEADLVDTSNEYNLWVLPTGIVLPFGFDSGGLVMTPEEVEAANAVDGGLAVQRPFQEGLTTGPEAFDNAEAV